MNAMTDARTVDKTVFVQILNAYSARNPCALISDVEYNECLDQLMNNESRQNEGIVQQKENSLQGNCGLQDRLGQKLFLKNTSEQNILVAGTKTRHQELIPFSRVYTALEELTSIYEDPNQLQQVVKERVLGIPEEIVQEYCCMASTNTIVDEQTEDKESSLSTKKCSMCSTEKPLTEFFTDLKEPSGVRSRCKDCDSRTRHKRKVKVYPGEEIMQEDIPKSKENSQTGFSGTAICAACGERKPTKEYDKERNKPLALKCRQCAEEGVTLKSKLCCSCCQDLTLDHFYRDSYTRAGFRPRCMDCMRIKKGSARQPGEKVERKPRSRSQQEKELENNEDMMQEVFLEPPRIPKQRRSSRRKRESVLSVKAIVEDPLTPLQEDVNQEYEEIVPVARTPRQRQRAKPKLLELETPRNKTGVMGGVSAKSMSAKIQKVEIPNQESKKAEVVRERAKTVSGTTVKDKDGNLTKCCTGCLQYKPTEEFGRDCSKLSGLRSRCRSCQRRKPRRSSPVASEVISPETPTVKKTPRKPNRKRKTGLKVCSKCDLEKLTSEFYRDRTQPDNVSTLCKRCVNASKKKNEKNTQSIEKVAPQNAKQKVPFGAKVEDNDMERVLNYVDALLPESSEESAGMGEFAEEEEIELSGKPECRSHRVCVGCHVDKSWIEFSLNPLLPAGLCPLCKDCLRGNGDGGRRLIKQRPKRRKCLRCKRPKNSIQFAKSLFHPNRITLVCEKCRRKEEYSLHSSNPSAASANNSEGRIKRRRLDNGIWLALDLMDYECDALRVRDPGGGENLWKELFSDSETVWEKMKREREMKPTNWKREGLLNTQLCLEKNGGVTLTHQISSENWAAADPLFNTENSFWKSDEKKKRKPSILEKQCKMCGEVKPANCFSSDSTKLCRLNPHCMECCKRGF